MRVKCTWWEDTGRHTPMENGVARAIFRNLGTGEEASSLELPIGALWAAPAGYYPNGADGHSICCRLPGNHTWMIDGHASNCTKPDDDEHRCWVRHGTIGEALHVDKNGQTCAAGAGSILVPGFHGFLHHGELFDC